MIQITIQSVADADYFKIKKYPAEFFDAKPKAYELSRGGQNEDGAEIPVTARNVHNGGNLFTNVAVADIEVNGETYETYEELSAVLTPILFKKGGGSGGGGTTGDLTLEQARQNGDILSGTINFDSTLGSYGLSTSTTPGKSAYLTLYSGESKAYIALTASNYTTNETSSISISAEYGIKLYDSKKIGIIADEEYDKQGDRLAFAQLSDVYDANSYSTEETKIGGTWIDGKPIYTITQLTTDPIPSDIDTRFPDEIIGDYTVYKYTKTTD